MTRRTFPSYRGLAALGWLYALMSAALALGPDAWMEWLMWGTTVMSVPSIRLTLAMTAGVVIMVLVWPLLRRP